MNSENTLLLYQYHLIKSIPLLYPTVTPSHQETMIRRVPLPTPVKWFSLSTSDCWTLPRTLRLCPPIFILRFFNFVDHVWNVPQLGSVKRNT